MDEKGLSSLSFSENYFSYNFKILHIAAGSEKNWSSETTYNMQENFGDKI